MEQESVNFVSYLKKRQKDDEIKFFSNPAIKKGYIRVSQSTLNS